MIFKFSTIRKGFKWSLLATMLLTIFGITKSYVMDQTKTMSVSNVNEASLPAIRLAVLGDSDSHSYGDEIWFPKGGPIRGGKFRKQTLQWTEILAVLRSGEIDQGRWGTWGTHRRLARIAGLVGIHLRTPRKQDYEYNFAITGAQCGNLIEDVSAQTPQFLRLVARDEAGWKKGIVQIRIGINTLGRREFLDSAATDALSETVLKEVDACAKAIESSVRLIREQQPDLRIVIIGILNNSDWPPYFDHWQSSEAQANINSVLNHFDGRLSKIAAEDSHVEFFDDRSWFRNYFGERDSDGKPAYRKVNLSNRILVANTQGDSPEHAILEDGHGGTLLNALWIRDFIDYINDKFGIRLTPVPIEEIITLAMRF